MDKKLKANVQIGDRLVHYNWIISSRRTKTISAYIDSNFQIVVKAPNYLDKKAVDSFVIKSYPNLLKRLYLKDNNSYFNLMKNEIKILGKQYFISYSLGHKKSTYQIKDDQIILKLKEIDDKSKVIKKILVKETENHIFPMLVEKVKLLNLQVNKIGVRDTKRSWAYTKYFQKFIYFNYKLVVFEKEIIDYVICHELMHLIFPNHSKEFWHYVSRICPNYKMYKRVLKNFF